MLRRSRDSSTRLQLDRGVSGESPPQLRSSASLVTQPPLIKSPRTRHIFSSRAVSEPGILIADLVYTLIPRKGVATPQYFREDWESEI